MKTFNDAVEAWQGSSNEESANIGNEVSQPANPELANDEKGSIDDLLKTLQIDRETMNRKECLNLNRMLLVCYYQRMDGFTCKSPIRK